MATFIRLLLFRGDFFRMFLGVVTLAICCARLAACLLPLLAGTPIYLHAGD